MALENDLLQRIQSTIPRAQALMGQFGAGKLSAVDVAMIAALASEFQQVDGGGITPAVSGLGFGLALGATTTQAPQTLFDARKSDRVVFFLWSSTDVDVTVQAIGSPSVVGTDESLHFTIDAPTTLVARGRLAVSINLDEGWYPYLGLTLTPVAGATLGDITISVYSQEK